MSNSHLVIVDNPQLQKYNKYPPVLSSPTCLVIYSGQTIQRSPVLVLQHLPTPTSHPVINPIARQEMKITAMYILFLASVVAVAIITATAAPMPSVNKFNGGFNNTPDNTRLFRSRLPSM